MNRSILILAVIFWAIIFQGCTGFNKGFTPVLPELPEKLVAASEKPKLEITHSLLEMVDDPQAAALVDEAIKNNYNLRATALRLKSSGLLLSRTKAEALPMAHAGYSAVRNNLSGGTGSEGAHKVFLSLNWELDLWGKLSARYGENEENFRAEELTYTRTMDSLAARVLQSYFYAKSNKLKLGIHEKRVKLYESIEQTILVNYQAGLGSLDDVSAAKTKSGLARSGLAVALDLYSRSVRQLETLLGRYPKMALQFSDKLPDVTLPAASVPASILENRPDIQAGLKKFLSAQKGAVASHMEMLPNISISANIFRENQKLAKLGAAGTSWGLAGNLLYPVFNAGRLKNQAEAADAQAEAAAMEYAGIIVQAMEEAENTFSKEQYLKAQLAHLEEAITHAKTSSQYYESRYRQGLIGIEALHAARDQELNVMVDIVDVKALRIINRVEMALALGTGVFKGSGRRI
ncbi:MAG: TolC family protein [Proteobacteria bacterium]|nr:TolC family protein [Pseudomonadota bacterium]